jgi:uncharacterized protein (DUF305 family)
MKLLFAALAAAALVSQAPAALAQMGHAHGGHGASASSPMQQSMMQGMQQQMHSMPMTGDADQDFARMMRMHHEHGIHMAQIQLDNGKDPALKDFARKTIEAQRKELRELDDWLARNKK